jgi:hypothetical protein
MTYALHHAVLAVLCPLIAWPLARTRLAWRVPRTAIVVWQALGCTWVLCIIGVALAVGLAPYRLGVLPGLGQLLGDLAGGRLTEELAPAHLAALLAGLTLAGIFLGELVACSVEVVRIRGRHRRLLALVARDHPRAPGALLLDHPAAAAYCLPGFPARVVVSAGALRRLDHDELAAVLTHERAHARGHHDLVLLPFAALRRVLPWLRPVRDAADVVSLLVEMCADDQARRRHTAGPLAAALLRLGASGAAPAPAGALAAGDGAVAVRVHRLLSPQPPLTWTVRGPAVVMAATLVATPLSLFVLPT